MRRRLLCDDERGHLECLLPQARGGPTVSSSLSSPRGGSVGSGGLHEPAGGCLLGFSFARLLTRFPVRESTRPLLCRPLPSAVGAHPPRALRLRPYTRRMRSWLLAAESAPPLPTRLARPIADGGVVAAAAAELLAGEEGERRRRKW
jgi:hypothetical protein